MVISQVQSHIKEGLRLDVCHASRRAKRHAFRVKFEELVSVIEVHASSDSITLPIEGLAEVELPRLANNDSMSRLGLGQ